MPKAKTQKPRGSTGRPKSPQTKDHWVSFRVTADELFRIMAKAEASGVSHVEYARSRTLRGIARKKKSAERMPVFDNHARELLHEARRQGVNLNQIAHFCNSLKAPPPPEFAALLRKLNALWDKLLVES
jgi:hypothetical protein